MNSPYEKLENSSGPHDGRYDGQSTNAKLEATRAEVAEVKGVMATNVNKLVERNDRLDRLQDRSADLEQGAAEFQSRARAMKRKYWWRNMKMWMILGVVALFIL